MDLFYCKDLNVKAGSFQLKDISITIPAGCVVGLVGRNGSGKTTLIDTIAHVRLPEWGTMLYKGHDYYMDEVGVKSWLGVVFDKPWFNVYVTPKRLAKAVAPFYPTFRWDFYQENLEKCGISDTQVVDTLSAGMKKKFMLIFAMACDPQLLLLDEPTSEIDPISRGEMLDLLLDFMQDETHSILFSTHITSDLDKIADYVIMLDDGKVLFQEEKESLMERFRKEHGVLPDIEDIMNVSLNGERG